MKKILKIFVFLFLVILMTYLVLWFQSRRTFPVALGINFSQRQADWLGFHWQNVYRDMLDDLKPSYIRLSAFWDTIEPKKGEYDFKDLDYMMNEAKKRNTKVTLVVGQKMPRWPECYIPSWAGALEKSEREKELLAYVEKVVDRYKKHAALEIWQIENEPFIHFDFGECAAFSPDSVTKEAELVRTLDTHHFTMLTDSGELGLWKRAKNLGHIFGTTLYRVVQSPKGRYYKYSWLPPSAYYWKSQIFNIPYERFFVAELQAEPWLQFSNPREVSLPEQEKSLSPTQLKNNLSYVQHVGASRAYLWGVEWWYWMKEHQNNPIYWNIVKEAIAGSKKATGTNARGPY